MLLGRNFNKWVIMSDFHDVRFPLDVALGAQGGPQRKTDIVTLASGREHRNSRWTHARRRYDAGLGVRTLDALHAVLEFFEERRGRLYGFRFRDRVDCKSCPPLQTVQALDQRIGVGDGITATFQLVKTYGTTFSPYIRPIIKPMAGTVKVAINGIEKSSGFACDVTTGLVTFAAEHIPQAGAVVTAGFEFDVPVRFESDDLELDLSAFTAGAVPKVMLVEIV